MSHVTRFRTIIQRALRDPDALDSDPHLLRAFQQIWPQLSRLPPLEEDERLWRRVVAEESGRLPRRERKKKQKPDPEGQEKLF